MKAKIIFILTLCCWLNAYSQHPTISRLKNFVAEADMAYYVDKAQQNLIDDYNLKCQIFGNEYRSKEQIGINLHKEKVIPILTIRFVNTENFNYDDNIYDYMVVDSIRYFLFACVDKKMRVNAFANFLNGVYAYFKVKGAKNTGKLSKVIKRISARKPELIMYCSGICDVTNFDGFMFIKNDKIYLYRASKNDVFELNDYIRRFFYLDGIRNLNQMFVPFIYDSNK